MLRVYSFETMNIEKTFKLTIKDTSFYLDATEINALYNECGKALNIGNTNPSYPPSVTKQPSDYPSWPTGYWPTGYPFGTTTDSNNSLNPKSSKGINFIKDDMTTIKDNTIKDCDNWRSSVQKSLDKLSAKTNGTTIR